MKKILIDKNKIKNSHDYDDLVNEMNSYNDPDFISKNKKAWNYRRRYFKDATSFQIGNIGAVILPNDKSIAKSGYNVSYQDYTIQFFYQGVFIGRFSKFHKSLSFDKLLEDSDIIENNIGLILDIIPFEDFTINYDITYAKCSNRPFIVE